MSYSALENTKAKIHTLETLSKLLALWRFKQEKVVFTNGCFDILHRGHVEYLIQASERGDQLIVGLNSDASVKKQNKGSGRPIQDQNSRAMILASLHCVDAVVIFDEETPYSLIELIKPNVLVKGGDWDKSKIVGADVVGQIGGVVEVIPFLEGYSTTSIEQKIKNG